MADHHLSDPSAATSAAAAAGAAGAGAGGMQAKRDSDLAEADLDSQQHLSARKRTRRACDRCSLLRVRCDGRQPCRRCEEYEKSCHYARKIGKRGRRPRSQNIAQGQQQKQQPSSREGTQYSDASEPEHELHQDGPQLKKKRPMLDHEAPSVTGRDADSLSNFSSPITGNNETSGRPHGPPEVMAEYSYDTQTVPPPPPSSFQRNRFFSDGNIAASIANEQGNRALPLGDLISPSLSSNRSYSFTRSSVHLPAPPSVSGASVHALITVPSLLNTPETVATTIDPTAGLRGAPPGSTQACRFRCLEPVVPILHGVIDAELACELLEMYFVEPGSSLFRCSSPYVLTHVLRKESLLRSVAPRKCTPALLVTMLWVSAQTAESSLFLFPGQKARVCEELRKLMVALIEDRDRDSWHRTTDGSLLRESRGTASDCSRLDQHDHGSMSEAVPPVPMVDDVLTFILLTIVVSGGDFKTDCFRWWNKTLRLSSSMGLNREDEIEDHSSSTLATMCTGSSSVCRCRACDAMRSGLSLAEVQEERRRAFWLIFCLDRHLALSFNTPLRILDDECQLYAPLADDAWESLAAPFFDFQNPEQQLHPQQQQHAERSFGAPTQVIGVGFFEYFLPLMTILGDVIQLHHQKCHPRFGSMNADHDALTALVEQVMEKCEQSIAELAAQYGVDALDSAPIPASQIRTPSTGMTGTTQLVELEQQQPQQQHYGTPARYQRSHTTTTRHAQAQLVTAYSSFILHVLHVLLHGKWDAVSMLDNKDGWIPSVGFMKCASHAVAASDAVSRILACDPELSFMPYLFGIYLLHGSFILLLFADRMPQIGLNESVERACEIIIRAHEVCVVTLSTEFQKRFRKVLRSTLYSVRSAGTPNVEESKARRRALSLYRWSNGSTGLAL